MANNARYCFRQPKTSRYVIADTMAPIEASTPSTAIGFGQGASTYCRHHTANATSAPRVIACLKEIMACPVAFPRAIPDGRVEDKFSSIGKLADEAADVALAGP